MAIVRRPILKFPMRAGTLVLFSDRPGSGVSLLQALDGVAPCRMRPASHLMPAGDCIGFVADLDLLQPGLLRGLRALIAEAPHLPRLFLLRQEGERTASAARSLGATLCLPDGTPPEDVAEAMRGQLRRPPLPPRRCGARGP